MTICARVCLFFFLMIRRPPRSTLFPYRRSSDLNLRYVIAVSGLPEEETRRAVYALALGGLITRERWPRALPAFVQHQTSSTRTAAPTPAAAPAEPQQPAAAEPEVKEAAAQAPAGEDP